MWFGLLFACWVVFCCCLFFLWGFLFHGFLAIFYIYIDMEFRQHIIKVCVFFDLLIYMYVCFIKKCKN